MPTILHRVSFAMSIVLLATRVLADEPDGATNTARWTGTYTLNCNTHVSAHATGPLSHLPQQFRSYERDLHPTLGVRIGEGIAPGKLALVVTTSGHDCQIVGNANGSATFTLDANQTCDHAFAGTDFSANLHATLTSGGGSLSAGVLELHTTWVATGDVIASAVLSLGPIKKSVTFTVPVEGIVKTDGSSAASH